MKPKYFTLSELCISYNAAVNNITNIPSFDVVRNLEHLAYCLDVIRDWFGKPIVITSGYRSSCLNALVGGSSKSYHMQGRAADITCDDLTALYKLVKLFSWTECYINEEKNYIHVAL